MTTFFANVRFSLHETVTDPLTKLPRIADLAIQTGYEGHLQEIAQNAESEVQGRADRDRSTRYRLLVREDDPLRRKLLGTGEIVRVTDRKHPRLHSWNPLDPQNGEDEGSQFIVVSRNSVVTDDTYVNLGLKAKEKGDA